MPRKLLRKGWVGEDGWYTRDVGPLRLFVSNRHFEVVDRKHGGKIANGRTRSNESAMKLAELKAREYADAIFAAIGVLDAP